MIADSSALDGLWFALAGLIVVVSNVLQSWWQRHQDDARAKKLQNNTDEVTALLVNKTTETADRISKKVDASDGKKLEAIQRVEDKTDQIHEQLNGGGIGKELKMVNETLTAHSYLLKDQGEKLVELSECTADNTTALKIHDTEDVKRFEEIIKALEHRDDHKQPSPQKDDQKSINS